MLVCTPTYSISQSRAWRPGAQSRGRFGICVTFMVLMVNGLYLQLPDLSGRLYEGCV